MTYLKNPNKAIKQYFIQMESILFDFKNTDLLQQNFKMKNFKSKYGHFILKSLSEHFRFFSP